MKGIAICFATGSKGGKSTGKASKGRKKAIEEAGGSAGGVIVQEETGGNLNGAALINAIKETKDFTELETVLKNRFGENFKISDKVKKMNLESVKEATEGLAEMADKYDVSITSFNPISGSAIMAASEGGKIYFNKKYFDQNKDALNTQFKNTERGWWPPNTGLKSIGIHEMAHQIDYKYGGQIFQKRKGRYIMNDSTEINSKVITSAFEILKAEKKASGVKGVIGIKKTIQSDISEYAKTNNMETIAEAFTDYYTNGKKASNFSRYIVEGYDKYIFGGSK